MIYRFDDEYNGEVVAEARRPELNPFLGLHYPSTDIPPQARALYEQSWLRLISDVGYTPAPIVPGPDEDPGDPLDLTHSILRSVSPIHIEYLRNMGVAASMSISLLRDGRLWGLIACHHYARPARAAVRGARRGGVPRLQPVAAPRRPRRGGRARGAHPGRAHAGSSAPRRSGPRPRAGVGPGGGDVPARPGAGAGRGRVRRRRGGHRGPGAGRTSCRCWPGWRSRTRRSWSARPSPRRSRRWQRPCPTSPACSRCACPEGACVVWLRHEAVHDVDWGGDPHNKAIETREGDDVRISPRKSFALWRETVRGRSAPWSDGEVRSAEELRARLLEVLLERSRLQMRAAETVQRSLLPSSIPDPEGWSVHARYEPAAGGRVGGDWYDALVLPDGRLAVVVGDVAGHGLSAAAAMGQIRNALRAYLLRGDSPGPDAGVAGPGGPVHDAVRDGDGGGRARRPGDRRGRPSRRPGTRRPCSWRRTGTRSCWTSRWTDRSAWARARRPPRR